jgi:hypothetical protein
MKQNKEKRGNIMLVFLNILILIAIFGVFAFSLWYTAFRLNAHFVSIHFWVLQVAVAVAAVGSVVALLVTLRFSKRFASIINISSGNVLLFIIFLFMLLAILHLTQLRWSLPLVWSGIAALAVSFIITTVGATLALSFVVKEIEIKIPGLENELSVMLISDVHIGHHRGRDYLAKIVEETNKRNPDLVLITGDLIDAEPAMLPGVLDPLSGFKAPVYFVEGNHEKDVGFERALNAIRQQGVHIMQNEVIETHGIQLIGLEYLKADENTFDMHPSEKTDTIKSVLEGFTLRNDMPSVLIHHSPVGVQYADAAGIDLMLSGHTHAGQIFPFSLIAKLTFPFNGGMYQQGNTQLFVSNGAGTYMVRMRLGSRNEINLLRLKGE